MNSFKNSDAFEPNLCSTSFRKHSTRRNTRKKLSIQTQELHECVKSDGRSGSTSELLSNSKCGLSDALYKRGFSSESDTDNATSKRKKQRISSTSKKHTSGVFQKQSDQQRSKIQNRKHDGMGCSTGNDTTESNRCGILRKFEDIKDMKRILLNIKNKTSKNKKKIKPEKFTAPVKKIDIDDKKFRWTQLEMRRCELATKLSLFINERGILSEKDKFKINCNIEKPPLLIITCSGRIRHATQVDEEIDRVIMTQIRGNPKFFGKDIKIVLDLKQVRDVYCNALDCILVRWMGYLNNRAKKIVIVLPDSNLKSILIDAVQCYKAVAASFLPNCEYYVVPRSRDVNSLL